MTDESELNDRLLNPQFNHKRTYWAQVERIPSKEALEKLQQGVIIQRYISLPCNAKLIAPILPQRNPPIRFRANIPTSWIELELVEGKNRQVRRMTAAAGHPILRLIRVKIGDFALGELAIGKWRELNDTERQMVFSSSTR